MESFPARIRKIPGGEDWWHEHNLLTFLAIGGDLIERGFTEDEAVDWLEQAYRAVADEFGA